MLKVSAQTDSALLIEIEAAAVVPEADGRPVTTAFLPTPDSLT